MTEPFSAPLSAFDPGPFAAFVVRRLLRARAASMLFLPISAPCPAGHHVAVTIAQSHFNPLQPAPVVARLGSLAAGALRSWRLLLVLESDQAILDTLDALFTLDRRGYRLVNTLDAALEALRAQRFDVIIADTMSRTWDPELLALHPLREAAPTTPLILFTAHSEAGNLDYKAAGLAAIWLKPLSLDDLLAALDVLDVEPSPLWSGDNGVATPHSY